MIDTIIQVFIYLKKSKTKCDLYENVNVKGACGSVSSMQLKTVWADTTLAHKKIQT